MAELDVDVVGPRLAERGAPEVGHTVPPRHRKPRSVRPHTVELDGALQRRVARALGALQPPDEGTRDGEHHDDGNDPPHIAVLALELVEC